MPKYADITIKISGHENDKTYIIAMCLKAMISRNFSVEIINQFYKEATKESDSLITTCLLWFNVE
jgi:hypothetical protein